MTPDDVKNYFSQAFDRAAVNEAVATLQMLHVFPVGDRSVKTTDCLLLLWVLATNTQRSKTEISLMTLLALENEEQHRLFYGDLIDISNKPAFFQYVTSIEFPAPLSSGFFSKINFFDNTSLVYGTPGAEQQTLCVAGPYIESLFQKINEAQPITSADLKTQHP